MHTFYTIVLHLFVFFTHEPWPCAEHAACPASNFCTYGVRAFTRIVILPNNIFFFFPAAIPIIILYDNSVGTPAQRIPSKTTIGMYVHRFFYTYVPTFIKYILYILYNNIHGLYVDGISKYYEILMRRRRVWQW